MTRNKSRPIFLLAAGLLWAGLAKAQESTNASGGDATGSGGTVAYSVGEIVYTTNAGSLEVQHKVCNMLTKFLLWALKKQHCIYHSLLFQIRQRII